MSLRSTLPVLALTGAAVLAGTAPAHAGAQHQPLDVSGHPPTLWTCSDGAVISANPTEGFVNTTTRTGPDGGPLIAMVLNLTVGITDTSSGEVLEGTSAWRMLIDPVAGTVTETGRSRKLTLPGVGTPVVQAGRFVSSFDSPELLFSAGRYVDVAVDGEVLCDWFGHED